MRPPVDSGGRTILVGSVKQVLRGASSVRRLEPGDDPRLQELCRRFKERLPSDEERLPSDEEAVCRLAQDDIHVWVAEVDGAHAGFTYAYALLRIEGDPSAFLYELDVDERFSRQGIGRALVEKARNLTERERVLKMSVDTSYDNEPAKRTYTAAGGRPVDEPTLVCGWRFR